MESMQPQHEYFVYKFYTESFSQALSEFGLVSYRELPLDGKISTLLLALQTELRQSPHKYALGDARHEYHQDHESTGLSLLSFVNRGVPRVRDNQIRMRLYPTSPELTVADIISDKFKFAVPSLCVEKGRFTINLGAFFKRSFSSASLLMRVLKAVVCFPLQGIIDRQLHSCVSHRIYSAFPWDSQDSFNPSDAVVTCPSDENLCDTGTVPAARTAARPAPGAIARQVTTEVRIYDHYMHNDRTNLLEDSNT